MSGKGNCYDNAMVETFFKTIKSELVWRTVFYTRAEAATGDWLGLDPSCYLTDDERQGPVLATA